MIGIQNLLKPINLGYFDHQKKVIGIGIVVSSKNLLKSVSHIVACLFLSW